jgi:hypothetical protein
MIRDYETTRANEQSALAGLLIPSLHSQAATTTIATQKRYDDTRSSVLR